MNKSVKAALLSGLVFPGVGQLSIGYKKRGWLIIFVIYVFLYLIMTKIMQQAASIVEKMQTSGVALDIESISNKTSELVGFSDNSYLNTLLVLFVLGWLISVIDAYFPGTK
ncbi:MAG: hypothetical protein KAJ39_06070 [Gammaproteobacteria bacterium]|nr:hypothetical protein [Gammaproteobacteria bacterium]